MSSLSQTQHTSPASHSVYLEEVSRIFWASKWLISGFTVTGIVLSAIVAVMSPNVYRAEALLTPVKEDGAGALSALAAQYGGLASLAGINLAGASSDKTALGLEILKSRKFIGEFVERRNILVPLMATKGWDARTNELIIDPDAYDVETRSWVRKVKPPQNKRPSLLEAQEEFRKDVLEVSQDKQTGFVTISVEHYSPQIAKQWVDWLVRDLNSTVMEQEVSEAQQAIKYLNKQIEATSLSELQTVFFRLIEEQTKTIMLASVSDEYLLKTLDPAVVPEKKSKPQRVLLVFAGAILSGFLGLLVAILFGRTAELQHPN